MQAQFNARGSKMKTISGKPMKLVVDTNSLNEEQVALAIAAGGFSGLQQRPMLCETVLDLSGDKFPVERADVAAVCASLVMDSITFRVVEVEAEDELELIDEQGDECDHAPALREAIKKARSMIRPVYVIKYKDFDQEEHVSNLESWERAHNTLMTIERIGYSVVSVDVAEGAV